MPNYIVTIFAADGHAIRQYFVTDAGSKDEAKTIVQMQTGWKLGIDYDRPFDVFEAKRRMAIPVRKSHWFK